MTADAQSPMAMPKRPRIRPAGVRYGKWVAGALVLIALVCVLAVAILPAPENKLAPQTIPPVNVRVLPIRPIGELADDFRLPGTVEPNRVVRISAEVPGRIEKVCCREGRPCQAGDKLLLLNTDLLKAEYDRAQATMDFDAREEKRIGELLSRGMATTAELDQARTKAAASRAAFESARASLERAVITAPIGGTLDRVPVEQGEYVKPGDQVAEIVDIETVKVVVNVPERDVHFLRVGQEEQIAVDPAGDGKLAGRISYIGELADKLTRTTRVEIAVDNRDRLLRSGQIITVRITRRILKDVILVPLEAVIPLEKGKRVYVVRGDVAEGRDVTLGFLRTRAGRTEVRIESGLGTGDLLIVEGHRYVSPGQSVRIVPSAGSGAEAPATAPVPAAAGKAAGAASPGRPDAPEAAHP